MSQKISLDAENFERIISLHLNYKWLNFQKKGLIELWSLAESEDDKELIEFLIKKFEYINTDRINEACLRFVEQIENRWNFSSQNTIVTAICDNANPDGSQHLV